MLNPKNKIFTMGVNRPLTPSPAVTYSKLAAQTGAELQFLFLHCWPKEMHVLFARTQQRKVRMYSEICLKLPLGHVGSS